MPETHRRVVLLVLAFLLPLVSPLDDLLLPTASVVFVLFHMDFLVRPLLYILGPPEYSGIALDDTIILENTDVARLEVGSRREQWQWQ